MNIKFKDVLGKILIWKFRPEIVLDTPIFWSWEVHFCANSLAVMQKYNLHVYKLIYILHFWRNELHVFENNFSFLV